MGRLRDFERQRGIGDTDLSNPAVPKEKKTKTNTSRARKKR